ncbi:class I SAM-dependent methyltransferase [Acaryochloris sp. CCMEE 5410]|uniref:class I SAM-dependent methyltransferase n=1 Tax=Acaryochloris sp. CCMEE 5410 TaxID=310037 RepID=UPI000248481C|nr:class I SAM-dependent methyltransferase [Acaryochloris sp. CCMEE 5410]
MDFGLTWTGGSAHRLTHFTVDDNPRILKTTVPQALWQLCVKGFVRILIGADNQNQYDTYDWEAGCHALSNPDLAYPQYYRIPNFHGIEGGYLCKEAAVTYDAVTAFACPPHEMNLRRQVLKSIQGQPQRILDLGCGTGSMTLMLKATYPQAEIIGLDLSPYMLCHAQHKSQKAQLTIHWLHGLAEATDLKAHSFDVISICMVFHEMPPRISRLVLQECRRLLQPGGQLIILDGNQNRLRHADWLIRLFREPYSTVYAQESIHDWVTEAGFECVSTQYLGWIHQLTAGTSPHYQDESPLRQLQTHSV